MPDEEVPEHHVIDCSTGKTTRTPLTPEEMEELRAKGAKRQAELDAAEKEEAELREQVKNHPDPLMKILAARLGIQTE